MFVFKILVSCAISDSFTLEFMIMFQAPEWIGGTLSGCANLEEEKISFHVG